MGNLSCNCNKTDNKQQKDEFSMKEEYSRNRNIRKKNLDVNYEKSFFSTKANINLLQNYNNSTLKSKNDIEQTFHDNSLNSQPTNYNIFNNNDNSNTRNNSNNHFSNPNLTNQNNYYDYERDQQLDALIRDEIDNIFILNLIRKIQKSFREYLLRKHHKNFLGMNNEQMTFSFISNNYNSNCNGSQYNSNFVTKSKKEMMQATVANINLIKNESYSNVKRDYYITTHENFITDKDYQSIKSFDRNLNNEKMNHELRIKTESNINYNLINFNNNNNNNNNNSKIIIQTNTNNNVFNTSKNTYSIFDPNSYNTNITNITNKTNITNNTINNLKMNMTKMVNNNNNFQKMSNHNYTNNYDINKIRDNDSLRGVKEALQDSFDLNSHINNSQIKTQPNLCLNIENKLVSELIDSEFKFYGCKINNNKLGFGIIIWENDDDNDINTSLMNIHSNRALRHSNNNIDYINNNCFKERNERKESADEYYYDSILDSIANRNIEANKSENSNNYIQPQKKTTSPNIPSIPINRILKSPNLKNNVSSNISTMNKRNLTNIKTKSTKKLLTKLIGSFKNNKLNGFCIFEKNNESKFQGELKENIAEGFGIFTNQIKVTYIGDWKDDLQNGIGSEYWPDGSFYSGEFKDGFKEGIGSYFWSDGSVYKGEWSKNSMHGFGEYITSDKKIYHGEFCESSMQGSGYLSINNSEKFYLGSFNRDKKEGFGIFVWTQPVFKAYIGFWKNSKQHGIAKFITEKRNKSSLRNSNKDLSTLNSNIKIEENTNDNEVKFGFKYGLWNNGERVRWINSYDEALEHIDGNQIRFAEVLQMEASELLEYIEDLKLDFI